MKVFHKVPALFFFMFFFASSLLLASSVWAANICVDDSGDGAANAADCDATCSDGSANCSLRDAIAAASASDHIVFSGSLTGQTINLSGSALSVATDLSIDGLGSSDLTISGQDTVPIFNVTATVSLSGLTLTNGRSTSQGGCILNSGDLTLDDLDVGHCEIDSNTSGFGIGIRNTGTLNISNSVIHDNQVTAGATGIISGGAISNSGTLIMDHSAIRNNTSVVVAGIDSAQAVTLTDVTIENNTATGSSGTSAAGAGILMSGVSAIGDFTNVTISGNQFNGSGYTTAGGAGLAVSSQADVSMTNCTIGANTVTGTGSVGGGLYVLNGASATLINVTIASNSATSGGNYYEINGNPVSFKNVLLGDAASGGDCAVGDASGPIDDGGNFVEDGSCGFAAGGDPLLGPLQNNGGFTLTYALLDGSPAIDAGVDTGCPATDQRGVTRPQGASCDSGAVEFTPAPTVDSTIDDLKDLISGFPADSFANSNNAATLINKLNALQATGNGTKNKLINDILSKGDGCGTEPDSNDWILDCDEQFEFQAAVQAILDLL